MSRKDRERNALQEAEEQEEHDMLAAPFSSPSDTPTADKATISAIADDIDFRARRAQTAGEAAEIVQGLKDVERESLDLTGADRVKLRRAIAWIKAH